MSQRRNVIFEIAGMATGFTSSTTTGAAGPASWATSFVEAITNIPRSQGAKTNPFDGSFDSQGTSVSLNTLAAYLLQRKVIDTTTITADITDTETTSIAVTSTSAFASSGTIFVGDEAIKYTGTTGTTFTTLTRGAFGTVARNWTSEIDSRTGDLRKVYEDNPFFEGRKCKITWYDPTDASSEATARFTGFISNPRFDASGYSIDVINGKKLLEDSEVMGGRYAKGTINGAFVVGSTVNNYDEYISSITNSLIVALDDPAYPFPTPVLPLYFQVDEEIVRYNATNSPSIFGTVGAVGTGGSGNFFETDADFRVGDYVTYITSSVTYHVTVTKNEAGAGGVNKSFRCYHNGGTNPATSDTVNGIGMQSLQVLFPGQLRTRPATHAVGAEVKEIRVLEGDHVDLVLKLLMSTGNADNGSWDTLATDWGAGIDSSLVDTASFDTIRDYSDVRRMIFDGPAKVQDLLTTLARVTASRIFWDKTGVLTVNAERDVYPDSASQLTIDTTNLRNTSIPQWSTPLANIYNSLVIRGNSPRGQEHADMITFVDAESVQFYGKRGLPDLDDGGLLISQSANKLEIIGKAMIARWSQPCIELSVELIFDELSTLEPGQLIAVTISHLPDLAGSEGLSAALFECIEVFPQDDAGSISVVAIQMPPVGATRLLGPAGEVSSLDAGAKKITLKGTAATHYASTSGKTGFEPLSTNNQSGAEDIHYFSDGDKIRIFDVSSFSGAAAEHAATITAIDYMLGTMTLDALPGWTIADKDIVTYDDYATTAANYPALSTTYGWLATGSPPKLNTTVAPHVWGL